MVGLVSATRVYPHEEGRHEVWKEKKFYLSAGRGGWDM